MRITPPTCRRIGIYAANPEAANVAVTPSGSPETASEIEVGGPTGTTRTRYVAGLPPTTAVAEVLAYVYRLRNKREI